MVEDPAVALAAALERLYLVFRSYGLKPHIEGCPCCVYDEDQDRVRSRSLRALTAEDFDTYASKALTTWGDADDLRHFLPRLLELVTGSPGDFISHLAWVPFMGRPSRVSQPEFQYRGDSDQNYSTYERACHFGHLPFLTTMFGGRAPEIR